VQETKAGDKRRMPMNSTVLTVLTSLRDRCATQPTDQVFPYGARYLRRAFERAIKAAGLVPFRFHDLRHTFASRLAMQGANDRTLMALGGWKSPAMLSRYAHLSPAHLFHAVEGLTRMGTAPKTATEESADEQHASKLLENVVSRLGLEPRALALKARKD
jgi:integrase